MPLSTLLTSPMIWGVILLMLLPIIGTLMWILKRVLKLSFSVGKVLLVLFCLWFVFTAVTGGLGDVFGNIGKARITHKEGQANYLSAFSKTHFNMADQMEEGEEAAIINTAFGMVTVTVPENTAIKLTVRGVGANVWVHGEKDVILFGERVYIVGSGSRIVEMEVNAAFMKVEFVHQNP
ncbi:hypothetical protein LJC20_00900 [Eubacteriales bacterium OttesenSCG-928-M02]|nr:hypothetical protein [Eubacteriales bacterium OttesenSCG-928-M02]